MTSSELKASMHESAAFLHQRGITEVDLAIILGSGLNAVQEILEEQISIRYADIPHMPVSSAPGHEGVLRYGRIGTRRVLMFCGRIHFYEGFQMWQVVYPIRILQALQVPELIITAAVGGLNQDLQPGDLVLLSDHINFMPDNPLRGLIDNQLGERFPDMTVAYSPGLRHQLVEVAQELGIALKSGVYVALQGPSLETQAECAFLKLAGADVVGMSVVPEVITGVQAGIKVAAVCVVSNMAWHPEDQNPSTVENILATAALAGSAMARLIKASCSAN